jgi:lipopolysaccharide export system permease protein
VIRIQRLDLYVARIVAGSYLVCFGFLVGLFVVFKVLSDLSDISASAGRAPAPYAGSFLLYVVAHYLTEIPYILLVLAPFITVTAGMFAVSRLMDANEIVPMIFTGRSVHRVLVPVFALALASIAGMGLTREYLLPRLSESRKFLADLVLEGEVDAGTKNIGMRLADGRTLQMQRYRPMARVMEGVTLFDRGSVAGDSTEVGGSRAEWRPSPGGGGEWVLVDGYRQTSDARAPADRLDLPASLTPGLIALQVSDRKDVQELSYSDLIELMRKKPDVNYVIVAFHYHVTYPLANLVLLLLALPFALRFERGSKTERVALAVGICGAFLVVDLIFRHLGSGGFMHPFTAAWLPTIIFGSLAAAFYDTIRT